MKRLWSGPLGALLLLALAGCGSNEDAATPAAAVAPPPATEPAPAAPAAEPNRAGQDPAGAISTARDQLKKGNVDEAAARLAQLQIQGASFNAQQAKDYRQALSEAYDRAIEAIQRGDPKGQAALDLLRAAAPR